MKGLRIMLLSLLTLLLLGCQGEVQYATPLRPVHYELYFATNGRALTAPAGYLRITKPSTATSAIGTKCVVSVSARRSPKIVSESLAVRGR